MLDFFGKREFQHDYGVGWPAKAGSNRSGQEKKIALSAGVFGPIVFEVTTAGEAHQHSRGFRLSDDKR